MACNKFKTAVVTFMVFFNVTCNMGSVAQAIRPDAIGAVTGNSIQINDTLLYEAPSHYPNPIVTDKTQLLWGYFREIIKSGPVTILQDATGNFIDVLASDPSYISELKKLISDLNCCRVN